MTDDLKAPERLWTASTNGKCHVGFDEPSMNYQNEYVRADRIATLEAALADMTRQRDAAIKSLVDVREETIRLNTATDAQYAKTVAKLREERDAAMAAALQVEREDWIDPWELADRIRALPIPVDASAPAADCQQAGLVTVGAGLLGEVKAALALLTERARGLVFAHHHGNGLEGWHNTVDGVDRAITAAQAALARLEQTQSPKRGETK